LDAKIIIHQAVVINVKTSTIIIQAYLKAPPGEQINTAVAMLLVRRDEKSWGRWSEAGKKLQFPVLQLNSIINLT